MRGYFVRRLLAVIPTLFGVSVLVFLMVRLVPGTVVDEIIGVEASANGQTREAIEAFFGLNQPIQVQYLDWVTGILHGNLGQSWRSGMPVTGLILSHFAVTAELSIGGMLIALAIGIPLGTISAIRENTVLDHVVRIISLFSLALPIFWQAAMMILILSLWFHWVPPASYVGLSQNLGVNLSIMILPCIVLGTVVAAQMMRMTRSALLEVLRQDFIRTARAKGVPDRLVIVRHALKNAFIPILTVAGAQVTYLLGGAVITEQVFTLPGIGWLTLNAIYDRDYPLVQGTVLFIAILVILTNVVVDFLYSSLDPRIRYG